MPRDSPSRMTADMRSSLHLASIRTGAGGAGAVTRAICGWDPMGARNGIRQARAMADDQLLSTTEYAALASELEALRSSQRAELAIRLRAAGGPRGGPDSDHRLTVIEEAAIEEARIAQLEDRLRSSSVVDVALAPRGPVAGQRRPRVLDVR